MNYLVLKVDDRLPKKKYFIFKDGKNVYDFDASLTKGEAQYRVYSDILRFGQGKYEIKDIDGVSVSFETADEMPSRDEIESGRELRPIIHYTAPIGWLNDPNGLVYFDGKFHLFAQHNPYSRDWGNMTWIHAVSGDLLHWEELGDALFPDEFGTMFSGSAVVDRDNVAGFGKDAIILFYTAAGNNSEMSKGQPFTQCLAYSTDNGMTFTKYAGNPIIPHIIGGNRDPKVVYSPELGRWIMALYLDGNDYRLFLSDDLIHWKEWENVKMKTDTECPNFYPLDFEGRKIWVLSGAADKYMLFEIKDKKLVQIQDEENLYYAKGGSYAAQVYSGTDPETIRLSWLHTDTKGAIFNSQIGVPTDMFLRGSGGKIRLGSYPRLDIMNYESEPVVDVVTEAGCSVIASPDQCKGRAVSIELAFRKTCPDFELEVFGCRIVVSPMSNRFFVNSQEAPLSFDDAEEKGLCVVADTLSAECFADGGLIYANYLINADREKGIVINTKEGADITVSAELIAP
ncbi:MAG: glycoside hydrolase family 32 protein [Clostridia bacterium]|nr:glycoside hydrolase family 32 protein [Clostridia bacterium]